MQATGLPIVCQHCGFHWNDGDFGFSIFGFQNYKSVKLTGNATNCPRCGEMTALPEGTFEVREGRWRLIRCLADDLRSAQATADDYARLLKLLRQAQTTREDAEQVANDIAMQTPFARLAETIRTHPPSWTAWLIAAILAIVLWRFPYPAGTSSPAPIHPAPAPVVLQHLSNQELDDLAKQIAHQLEQRRDISQPSKDATLTPKGSQRNKPCPCGSEVKYKKCCGSRTQVPHP
jgi:SEC-C motif